MRVLENIINFYFESFIFKNVVLIIFEFKFFTVVFNLLPALHYYPSLTMKFNRDCLFEILTFYFICNESARIAARLFNTWKRQNNVDCENATRYDVVRLVQRLRKSGVMVMLEN